MTGLAHPEITTSPSIPPSRNRSSSSAIRSSGPAAIPTEPGLRGAGGSGLEAIWCVASVMP